jgi:hypothetical protein
VTYRTRCERRREEVQAVQKMRAGWWHLFGAWRPSFSYVKLLRIERRAKKYEAFFGKQEERVGLES